MFRSPHPLTLPFLCSCALAQIPPLPSGEFRVYTSASLATPGLVGSYVNRSLRAYTPQDDWRISQIISGTRIDTTIEFLTTGWGSRASVGLTSGSDANWDNFSVQWDGYIQIVTPGTQLATLSDDGSRMWVDVNGDGLFSASGPEYINNHWGSMQGDTIGDASVPLAPGVYKLRIQYEDGIWGNRMRLLTPPRPTVRCGIVVPSDRAERPELLASARGAMLLMQQWCIEEMDRYGQGRMAFRHEVTADGITPRIHWIHSAQSTAAMAADPYSTAINACTAAGGTPFSEGIVWVLLTDCATMNPDGSIVGGVALGASTSGSGRDGGVAVIGGERLGAFPLPDSLTDDRPYSGLIVPALGPYPLVQDVSFAWFEGTTISSVMSASLGAVMHETGHALGLPHDTRHDDNYHGNLMGNGLRGMRGELWPDRYGAEDCRVSYVGALRWGVSQYFRPVDLPDTAPFLPESVRPTLAVLTTGAVTPAAGLVRIAFQASDAGGLALAALRLNGDFIAERRLSGTDVSTSFDTPYFTPLQTNNYEISVYDSAGNLTTQPASLLVNGGVNRGPVPFFKAFHSRALVGEAIDLNATATSDPDSAGSTLRLEWDLDGDGVYDTPQLSSRHYYATYDTPGARLIYLRVRDPAGAVSVGTPIAVRIDERPCLGDFNQDGGIDGADVQAFFAEWEAGHPAADVNADGGVDGSDVGTFFAAWETGECG